MEGLINPLQEQIEEWKRGVNTLDKDYAKGKRNNSGLYCNLCNFLISLLLISPNTIRHSIYTFSVMLFQNSKRLDRK